ncbi:helix-turn-helix domain-containing protein [Streptomyces canus]|uniref:helix-turn-helix domain-containing protein n=1 Tax=Streptomyces canus TaxID=58343 RepID=UPI0030DF31A8
MTQQPDFGSRVRKRRLELGMSQRQLAGDSVTSSYISLLESGQRVPTLDVILHLAKNLQLSLEELIGPDIDRILPRGSGEAPAKPPSAEDSAAEPPQIAQLLIQSALESHDFAQAIEELRTLTRQAQDAGQPSRILELGLQLQALLRTSGLHEERSALLAEMLDLETVRTSPSLQVSLLTPLAAAQRDQGRLAEARASAESARARLPLADLEGTAEHVRLLGVLISTLCELSELTQVPALIDEMLRLATRLATPGLLGRSLWVAAMALSQLGDSESALERIMEARRYLSAPTLPLQEWTRFCRTATNILITAGRLEEAQTWLAEAESTSRNLGVPAEQSAFTLLKARYESSVGNRAEALRLYQSLTGEQSPLSGLQLARACLAEAEVLCGLGRSNEAVEVLRKAAVISEQANSLQLALQMWRQIDEIRHG